MKDSILGSFHFHQSLHHIRQRARNLTALTVPEIEIHLFSTQIPTTASPESSETYPNRHSTPPVDPGSTSSPPPNISSSTTSSITVNCPAPSFTPDASSTETHITHANTAVTSSPTETGAPLQTSIANIPSQHVNILPIPDIDQSILPSNAPATPSSVPVHPRPSPNDNDVSCTPPITQTLSNAPTIVIHLFMTIHTVQQHQD